MPFITVRRNGVETRVNIAQIVRYAAQSGGGTLITFSGHIAPYNPMGGGGGVDNIVVNESANEIDALIQRAEREAQQ